MGKEKRAIGIAMVLIGASFWGIGGTVSQRLFQESGIPVNWLVTVRLLIAGMLLIGLAWMKDRNKVFQVWKERRDAIQIMIFGLVGMLSAQYTYMASISHGNAAVATLLQYLGPVVIIVYLVLRGINKFSVRDLVGVIFALSGTFLLLTNGSAGALAVPVPAVVWGLLSAIALAFYTLYPAELLKKYGSLTIIGWAMLIGGVGMSFIHPPWNFNVAGWGMDTVFYLAFVIVFGTMIAFWFYLGSLSYLKPQETSLLSSVEPLAAIVTSVVWLHVSFGFYQVIGMGLIFCMIIYLAVFKEKVEVPDIESTIMN
ncbi:DMT family transporter [Chungangia koreensis]|uniref:DMT family transporter n=1 Tax=Chungangia koreensis TaxID=752657 RepID=A0ABV8X994_9LACT